MKRFLVLIMCSLLMLSGCNSTVEVTTDGTVEKKTDDIFDTSYVHEINIKISEEDWNDLITNPLDKTKYKVNITIDGNTLNEVSFATKGNTSLSSVANDKDSNRYSFKINFVKYVKGQKYQGIKKLNLNNLYADATYMKDYISYRIFDEADALGSRTSYVWLKINGEDFGYLAIEEVDQSFLDANTESLGSLYKPESEMLDNIRGGGKQDNPFGDFDPSQGNPFGGFDSSVQNPGSSPEDFNPSQGNPFGNFDPFGQSPGNMPEDFDPSQGNPFGGFDPSQSQDNGFEGFDPFGGQTPGGDGGRQGGWQPGNGFSFGSDNGASLKYKDDEISSYSDIFDNAETDVTEEDQQRVIKALKLLSEGNREESVDIENTIRYFAAHNFVINYDSYTGSMLHNYYLYEKDGKLTMIPWDYNLAFGGFGGAGNATSTINSGIDSPLSSASESDRPMWAWIAESEEYTEQYHEVYKELIENYFDSGKFEQEFDRIVEMIRPYVEKDTSSFYGAQQFETAVKTLKQFCLLRAESISKQINGELATVTANQNEADKVDASSLNISSMGNQGGGSRDGRQPNDSNDGWPNGGNGGFPSEGGRPNSGNGGFPSDGGRPNGSNGWFPSDGGRPNGGNGGFPSDGGWSNGGNGSWPNDDQGGYSSDDISPSPGGGSEDIPIYNA